jgi:hypothetical protein
VEYVILTRPSRAYKFDYATDAEGYDFGRNSTAPKLILTSPNITFLRGCPAEALANDTNRTVHGGQREYRYRAVTDGQITVKLVGGGAGGTGAAAARDTSGGTNTSAAAGKAGNGGPTILYLDNQNRLTVAGGTGQNGPASGLRGGWFLGIGHNSDWNLESGNVFVSNGYKGEDGKEDTITLTVSQNQVIRITVGWGGGGSGGCAINVVGGQISSEGASNSCFSIEKFDRRNGYTDAIASRGGLGAMHSLLCPNPAHNFPDDLVHGGVSLAAGNATAAPGGQKMGEGGEGGDELATGGVFASGGGGGAAGGFIFSNSTAIIEEIPPEEW